LRIPGEFGVIPPVDPDGKPRGGGRAGKGAGRGRPDIIDISVYGKRLGAGITSRRTVTVREDGLDPGARARVERRLAGGFYEREDVLAALADRLVDVLGR